MLCRLFVSCLLLVASASAWTVGSSVSGFGGGVLITDRAPALPTCSGSAAAATLEMKKGKPNVPPQMRGQYKKMQQMQQMRDQMVGASKPGADGLPVFNLFVRTKRANMWYPCGSFKGDDRSAALAKGYADGGLLSGLSKKQLDGGIAGSLWSDLDKLKESICRTYPQLKKSRAELEFGYKLAFEGIPEDEKIVSVEPKEQKGAFDAVRNLFS